MLIDSILYQNILAGHKIKQFDKFLKSSENKKALIRFLAREWKTQVYRILLGEKVLYKNADGQCWKVMLESVCNVDEIWSDQEETDTKMILHAKHTKYSHLEVITEKSM